MQAMFDTARNGEDSSTMYRECTFQIPVVSHLKDLLRTSLKCLRLRKLLKISLIFSLTVLVFLCFSICFPLLAFVFVCP